MVLAINGKPNGLELIIKKAGNMIIILTIITMLIQISNVHAKTLKEGVAIAE